MKNTLMETHNSHIYSAHLSDIPNTHDQSASGNILFIILIAVVLFGFLSFAITQSLRGSNNSNEEQLKLQAAELLQTATLFENTITRLKLINSCSTEDISFEQSIVSGYTHTVPAPDKCKIFHSNGGGMSWREANLNWLHSDYTGSNLYGEIAFSKIVIGWSSPGYVGTAAADVVMIVPYISDELCSLINELVNASVGAEDGPRVRAKYNGNFLPTLGGMDNPWGATPREIEKTACVRLTGDIDYASGSRVFYHVLIER